MTTGGGPPISPDGRHYWDGTGWQPMPRARRGHRKTYSVGSGALAILVILAAVGLTNGPLRWSCTVQQNGANMEVQYTGLLAGLKCDNANGFNPVGSPSGGVVCSYPIGLTRVVVYDTGLQILGSAECSDLQTQYNQQHAGQSPPAPT